MEKRLLVTLLILMTCVSSGYGGYQDKGGKEEGPPKPYFFAYGVQDKKGAGFGHKEESDGKTVKGSYTVDLPDGRTQIVNYIADHKNGYQAEVTYIGEAKFPEAKKEYSEGHKDHGNGHNGAHDHHGHESQSQKTHGDHDHQTQQPKGHSSYVHHGPVIHADQNLHSYDSNDHGKHIGESGGNDHNGHESQSKKTHSDHDHQRQQPKGHSSYVHNGPVIHADQNLHIHESNDHGKNVGGSGGNDHNGHESQSKEINGDHDHQRQQPKGHSSYVDHSPEIHAGQNLHSHESNDHGKNVGGTGGYDHNGHDSKNKESHGANDHQIQQHKSYVQTNPEVHNGYNQHKHESKDQGKQDYLQNKGKDTVPTKESNNKQGVYDDGTDGHVTRENIGQNHGNHNNSDDGNESYVEQEGNDSQEKGHGHHYKDEDYHGRESDESDGPEGEDDHHERNDDGAGHDYAVSKGQEKQDQGNSHGHGKDNQNDDGYDSQENVNDVHTHKKLNTNQNEEAQEAESDNYLNFFGPDDKEWYENDDDHFH